MAIPSYQALMRPVLEVVSDGNPKPLQSVISEVADVMGISEEEREKRYASGNNKVFANRVGWARSYLNQAELLCIPERGMVQITETGQKVLQEHTGEIDKNYLKQFDSFNEFYNGNNKSAAGESDTDSPQDLDPQERLEQAHREIQSSLASDLLQQVKQQSPQFFENLVVQLMQAMSYGGWAAKVGADSGQATQYSNDGGIDGVINEDPLGLETIYLQAKRYTDTAIGRPDIQAFVGALEMKRARKGVFITTSRFSKDAQEYITKIEKKVVLIDGKQLAELMIQHSLGVSVKETYQVKSIDTDYFLED